MLEIFVDGLEFYAFHGVPEAERQVGHRYRLDLILEVDSGAEHSDKISETVDYAKVSQRLLEIAAGEQVQTMERLGQKMAEAVLKEFQRVRSVRIELRKMAPPMPVIAESAGIAVELRR